MHRIKISKNRTGHQHIIRMADIKKMEASAFPTRDNGCIPVRKKRAVECTDRKREDICGMAAHIGPVYE
jgi:hypothetical protein